ncbi:MAG: FAD binding domain-containing protein [Pseudomonadota bacterium]
MMRLPKMSHVAPMTIDEACSMLKKHRGEARVLAGGTDLLVACKLRNVKPVLLVSLGGISELKGVRPLQEKGVSIGTMTPLRDLGESPLIRSNYPALAQAAASVGSTQLRSMGTLGGNLCLNTRCIYYNQSEQWRKVRAVCFKMGGNVCHVVPKGKKCYAIFSGDTAPALIALDAQATLVGSGGERRILVKELYRGDGKKPLNLKPGEVLSEITLPPLSGKQGSTYLKFRLRGSIDFPLTGVAVRMDFSGDGICENCKVALTAVGPGPMEALKAQEVMIGKAPTMELIAQAAKQAAKQARPLANTPGSTPAYRRKMVEILTRRALLAVTSQLGSI